MKKILFLLLSIPFFLTGCSYSQSVENYYYVVALAIDKSDTSNLKLSIQIASPSSESDSSTQSSESKIYSVDCETIDLGITILDNYLSKKLNFSHCSAIIFSEELAKSGIKEYANTLANNPEIRPSLNVLISNEKASSVLEQITNSGEKFSARYYESVIHSVYYTGYSVDSQFSEFFRNINSDSSPAIANYMIIQDDILQSIGGAVFKEDKLDYTLSPTQSLAHLITTGNVNSSTINLENPLNTNENLEINIQTSNPTSFQAEIIDQIPYVQIDVNLEGILKNTSSHYSKETIEKIELSLNDYIENLVYDYLTFIIKEKNSDLENLKNRFAYKYLTQENFDKLNWNKIYNKTNYKIKVNSTLLTSLYKKE